jgi:hypothetical protein
MIKTWLGFAVLALVFTSVKIELCCGEPKPEPEIIIATALGAVSSAFKIAESVRGFLSSAGQVMSNGNKEGGIYIRHQEGGCLEASKPSAECAKSAAEHHHF